MLKLSIVNTIDEFKTLREQWDNTLNNSGSDNVFLTYEWLSTWLYTFGVNTKPFVIIVRKDDDIVAIAPLVIIKNKELGMPVRKIQFMGSPQIDYADFIIAEKRAQSLAAIFNCILENANLWNYIELSHITDESPNWKNLSLKLKTLGIPYNVQKWSICPYISVYCSFEKYYKERSKNLRYDIRRNEKRLKTFGRLDFEIINNEHERIKALPHFFKMLKNRELGAGRSGPTSSYKMFYKFFMILVKDSRAAILVHFTRHTLNNETIAYHFGFRYKNKIYWYKPTFDQKFKKYSPGSIHIKKNIEYAVDEGISEFDFLLGDEPYKERWATNTRPSYNIIIFNKNCKSKFFKWWLIDLKPKIKKNKTISTLIVFIRKRLFRQ